MNKIKAFMAKRKYWLIGALIILFLGGWWYVRNTSKAPLNVFAVRRGEIISEVSVTGKVKPAQSLDLAFEKTGRIAKIYFKVGAEINEGRTLVNLDNADLYAQLAQAEASVKAEEAKLTELKSGTREEDIKVKQSELEKTKQDLINYYRGVPDVLADAYAKADDAVRIKMSNIFDSPKTGYQITFTPCDVNVASDASKLRAASETGLDSWKEGLAGLGAASKNEELSQVLAAAQSHLNLVKNLIDKTKDVLVAVCSITVPNADTYLTNVSTARSNMVTVLTNVNNREQDIASQKLAVQKVEDELNLKLAGTVPEQVAAQEAKVLQAKANADYERSQLAKTILRAPFSGIVTKVDFDPGDIVSLNTPVISLIGRGAYQIEVNIAESDIAKVKVGNPAKVTLDAYGPSLVFDAKVAQIDLSATIIEGVPTYKTTLIFSKEDARILAGLTANVDILSDQKENVLYVPTRNIISRDSKKFVKLVKDKKKEIFEEVGVAVGLRGSDGRTEIISGLKEGDRVVVE